MDLKEARSYLNYLLTLNIRREEAFGPMALAFIKDHDLGAIGLEPEEQFGLLMATAQSLADEPKRFSLKLEMLQKTKALLTQTRYSNTDLSRQLDYDIKKTESELAIYNDAMRPAPRTGTPEVQQLIVQTDVPEYFLDVAQKRASEYYQNKFGITKQAKTAQHFTGGPRKFEPDNKDVHREFPGACAPFMNSRTNAFHMMLPFDLKISKKPDDPLDAGSRIFYTKFGYSFPLAYEMDKLISYQDGQVLDIARDDPNLLFVSFSRVKEKDFKFQGDKPTVPPELAYPMTVLERLGTLGTYLQIVANFKVWFDAAQVSVLVTGAPDLYEYGLQGGSGLMTRSHASDKVPAYAESVKEPWQEGLSFNFVNIHLTLNPGTDTATVPYNTPLFTVYPVLNRQNFKFVDKNKMK
ncbi:MAG: hypothetical protein E2O43_07905 [Nitrospina sp.]|nr:MAG: hypothetical protein E2O43_07905 [Nitrospina sp.]